MARSFVKRPSRVTRYAKRDVLASCNAPRFAGCNLAWIAWGMGQPYIAAKHAFVAGHLTVSQAAALICQDRDFIAEHELSMRDDTAMQAAERIVREQWALDLIKAQKEAA